MGNGNYYDRQAATHVDGTPMFLSEHDEQSEAHVASLLELAWSCRCRSFGRLSPVDWYFERDERLIGVGELKSRSHGSDTYPTVFLNVRKWLALLLCANGLGVPAIFVVRFDDCVRWIPVSEIDATGVRISGCRSIVKSRNDIEPVIEVKVSQMKELNHGR